MEKKKTSSFKTLKSVRVPENVKLLRSEIQVADATLPELKFFNVKAIWDTGASSCGISKKMGLISRSFTNVEGVGSNETQLCETFSLTVMIEGYVFKECFKTTAIEYDRIDFLIGLDLIRQGRLSLTVAPDNSIDFLFGVPQTEIESI